ncbi:type II toxin-antitoxin system VapC family toxin, partial [Candidatus Poribacteria bacterium]|nr:type II toxin-antitoxin system VapC family toxin [Candidatus Poribacteria bacterium]
MLEYNSIKPRVYIEPTVISHLVARPSDDETLANWQKASRQLWEVYADRFEFVISPVVRDEIKRGDVILSRQRLEIVSSLTVLELSQDVIVLVDKLLDTGVVPLNSVPDAQHIAVATVHNIEYLVSWNHKHIVNEHKREQIK